MSSSLTRLIPPTQSQASAKARLLTPTTQPVPLLSSTLAKRYSYIHTALIPTYYYIRASELVADPLPTLVTDVVFVALAQALFCAISLPSAGSWISGTNGGKIIEGTATIKTPKSSKVTAGSSATGSLRKKTGPVGAKGSVKTGTTVAAGESVGERVMPTFFSLVLTLVVPPIPLTIIALVLGAPLYPTSLLPVTLLLSLHVSLLAFLPIFYAHGVSSGAWRDVAAAWLPFDEAGVWAGTVGAMIGGWVGAVPIALDWDREWQKWPCTVVWGVVLGWTLGRLLTTVAGVGLGKRIDLSEKEEESHHSRPEFVIAEKSPEGK